MKTISKYAIAFIALSYYTAGAQDTIPMVLKVKELFELTEKNSIKLAIGKENIEVSRRKTEIAKSARLPEIEASVSFGYLSNATVLNPNFSYAESIALPHISNNYEFAANEILYKGNAINTTIAKAKLEEQLSELNFEKDKDAIKILLLGRYLELYGLYNQQQVYKTNINLAKVRLKNINDLHKEGMVTKNDVIRSELQITDLELLYDKVNNNIAIVNRELCVVLGLPVTTKITVDPALTTMIMEEDTFDAYLSKAFNGTPAMRSNAVNETIAEKNIRIAKAEKLPVLSLYASDGNVRPYIYVMPPLNNYVNLYQFGIKLSYNISSLYHAKEHIELAEIQQNIQKRQSELVREQTELEVNASFIKYREAKKEFFTRQKSRELADDNYRIVEKKYLNQLALLTDMLDASTSKLTAELNQSNAGITIVYQWYQLQKATGNLL